MLQFHTRTPVPFSLTTAARTRSSIFLPWNALACAKSFKGQKNGYDLERDNKSGRMSACNLQSA